MKKLILSFAAIIVLSSVGFAQTKKTEIERRMKDPKTAEDAGKADVYILKKKTIDSLDPKPVSTSERKKKKANNRKNSE